MSVPAFAVRPILSRAFGSLLESPSPRPDDLGSLRLLVYQHHGVPQSVRASVWRAFLRLPSSIDNQRRYAHLVERLQEILEMSVGDFDGGSSDSTLLDVAQQVRLGFLDLVRSYPHRHPRSKAIPFDRSFRVYSALVASDYLDDGYTDRIHCMVHHKGHRKGLTYVPDVFLWAGMSEEDAFVASHRLVRHHMPVLWDAGKSLPAVAQGHLVYRVLSVADSELRNAMINKCHLRPEISRGGMLQVMFTEFRPISAVLRLWDFMFAFGAQFCVLIIAAIFVLHRRRFLSCPGSRNGECRYCSEFVRRMPIWIKEKEEEAEGEAGCTEEETRVGVVFVLEKVKEWSQDGVLDSDLWSDIDGVLRDPDVVTRILQSTKSVS